MQVKWLRRVLHNLEEEAAHIARDNPQAAAALVRKQMNPPSSLPASRRGAARARAGYARIGVAAFPLHHPLSGPGTAGRDSPHVPRFTKMAAGI